MSGQPPTIRIAVEGEGDIAMAEALARHCGGDPTPPKAYGGKPKLDPVIPRLNQAGRNTPWLVLRDCDLDDRPHNGCRGRLVTELGNGAPSEFFALRLAVRALEAWLMADSEGVAQHFGVPVSKVPRKPDSIEHPKDDFIKLLRLSKRRNVQQGMLPRAGSGRSAGPEYTAFVNQFVRTTWSIDRAAANSDSLNRALADVGRLGQRVGG